MSTLVRRETRITRTTDVIASQMDAEYVMASIESGSYFTLRNVSARIWELLEQPRTMAELLDALHQEYAVPPDVCEQEVSGFLRQMSEKGLITLAPPL